MKLSELTTLTKDQIAQSAMAELKANGARVRKVHNVPVRRRKNHIEKGWSDVQGYDRQGRQILCEIKTANDKLSEEQKDRLEDLDNCGGIALLAVQHGLGVNLIPWKEYKITI